MPKGQGHYAAKKSLQAAPTAAGVLSRLAAERAVQAGIDIKPLLERSGLPPLAADNPELRVGSRNQIEFIGLVSEALGDIRLGFHLARYCDPREIGPFYYLLASSGRLGTVLELAERYSSVINEGMRISRGTNALNVDFEYVGIDRDLDRHQIEFWITYTLRLARTLTAKELAPTYVGFIHHEDSDTSEVENYFGCDIEFDAVADRIAFDPREAASPVVFSDPYLNRFFVNYFDQSVARIELKRSSLRSRVENAIMPRLPHGTAIIGNIASELGMSARTLSRRLADEDLTFSSILEDLRRNLAIRHLQNNDLSISQIAWLLGYTEVSSFAHAFQRWTGRSPTYARRHIAQGSEGKWVDLNSH